MVDGLRRFVFQGTTRERYCEHLDQVSIAEPPEPLCPSRDEWVHVRMCLTCGELGCCDSSSAQHARQHFEQTGHPMIRSIELGEQRGWCYVDKAYLRGTDFLA
ncbi:MAG TPA: UBP-type zinc finger domain-containing protein [Acidimicrobiia bacterium]